MMENFDDLIKNKINAKKHAFRSSYWQSFCRKAGIKSGISVLKFALVASLSAVSVAIIVGVIAHFNPIKKEIPTQTTEIRTVENFIVTETDTVITPKDTIIDFSTKAVKPIEKEKNNDSEKVEQKEKPEPVTEKEEEKRVVIKRQMPLIDFRIDTIKSENQLERERKNQN